MTLVEAGQHVFAAAPSLSVGAGPHIPARFAGDDQFVPVGPEITPQMLAEIRFSAAIRRALIVGQVKVGDSQVKGCAQHLALGLHGGGVAEVMPQAQ